ncbi:hypothetical protein [Microbaculum marinum]|uniref:HPt domain-containing protein n=1 Tax=Microbaculum marinum TaxID=1764581 RepID=A0AAW9RPW9_9HYPH
MEKRMGRSANTHRTPEAISVTPTAPPVDLVHLTRHSLGDTELEREVLQLFVAQSSVYLNRLKEASNGEQWRRATRTISGAARGIGAWNLAASADTAALFGHNVEDDRSRNAIIDVENQITLVNAYIRSLFLIH